MKKIGIICGGFSSEFEISIKSAQVIFDHFPKNYDPLLIEVNKETWVAKTANGNMPFDLNAMTYGPGLKLDAAIVYIHGNPGENGKIQALLDMKQIPYVNSGVLASALSFDKYYCNQYLNNFNIPVAKSLFFNPNNLQSEAEIINYLGLPLFVKPSDSGSSYGISKVKEASELNQAIQSAFQEGETIVLESFLNGTEVTCGVYRTRNGIKALPLTEIQTEEDFFNYDAKYLGKSREITPAQIEDELRDEVQHTAIKIYEILGLKSIARIDFMIVDRIPHVIEVNTTPGFSAASIVPQMIKAEGGNITDFWAEILNVELENR